MNKTLLLFICILLGFTGNIYAAGSFSVGHATQAETLSKMTTRNGNLIIAGLTTIGSDQVINITEVSTAGVLIRTDNFNLSYSGYGNATNEFISDVIIDKDNNIVVYGRTTFKNTGRPELYVLKVSGEFRNTMFVTALRTGDTYLRGFTPSNIIEYHQGSENFYYVSAVSYHNDNDDDNSFGTVSNGNCYVARIDFYTGTFNRQISFLETYTQDNKTTNVDHSNSGMIISDNRILVYGYYGNSAASYVVRPFIYEIEPSLQVTGTNKGIRSKYYFNYYNNSGVQLEGIHKIVPVPGAFNEFYMYGYVVWGGNYYNVFSRIKLTAPTSPGNNFGTIALNNYSFISDLATSNADILFFGDLLPVPGSDNFLISYLENDLNTSTVQTKISSMNGINGAVNWTVVSNQTMSITRYSDMQIINNQIYCNTIASNNYYVFNPLFNANATSIGNGNLCYTRSNMPLLNLNFYQANQTNLTNIFNNQDVTINETDATSTATVSKTLCTNCLALNTQSTIVIPDETVINSSVLWGAVGTAQKYYIEGELTVNNAILDITNIDVIFGPCARINFVNNGRIRANNSVFRSCDENAFWDGLYFDMSADNKIESCVFKNASRALSFNFNSTANVSNNEFLNCYRGIEITGHLNFNNPISNNQFIIDRLLPTTAECVNNVPVTACFGIVLNNSIVNGEISQNNFIQNLDASRNVNLSGLNATNSAFTASENTFTNNFRAFDIIGERDIANNPWKIINNNIEFTRLYKTNLSAIQAHQIYIKGGIENPGNEISKNTIRKTSTEVLPNTMGIMLDPDAGGPKSALRIMNVVIKENYIEGFSYGTYCLRTRNIMVTKNTYKNNSSIGVLFHESSNLFITCNTIDMLNDNSNVKFGIQVGDMEVIQGSTAFGKIHSNCIFNTERGMFIYAPYPNSPCPQAPEIRNNYIYNFINSGIYIRNMSTAIGDNVFPGMNSFISNTYPTTQAWDIEVVSQNVLIPSIVSQKENYSNKAFNFTPNVTGDPYGLDKIKYSIASCANQNQHQQGGFAFHGKYSDALDCQSKAAFSPWGNPGGDGGGGGQIPVFVSGNRLRIYQYIHTHVWNKNDHETLTNWMDMIKTNPNLKAEDHAEMEYLMSIKIQDEDNQLKLIKANMNTSNFFYLEALKNNLVDADRNKLISISMDSLYTQTCYFLLSKMGSPLVFNSIIPEMESTELNSSLNSRRQMLPMSIYPNPISEGDIKVDINMDGFTGFKNIKILDFMGMEVFSAEVYLMNGTVQINVNDFNPGVYNLILTDESGKTFVGKFVKL